MKSVGPRRSPVRFVCAAAGFLAGASCYGAVPDPLPSDVAGIISRAPEFNRYARLVQVERIDHQKGSLNGASTGRFTFHYLNSPTGGPPLEARVDLRYHEGRWYLNRFDYGCPADCHFVEVYGGPEKLRPSVTRSGPTRWFQTFSYDGFGNLRRGAGRRVCRTPVPRSNSPKNWLTGASEVGLAP
jgi:hypothetical protein